MSTSDLSEASGFTPIPFRPSEDVTARFVERLIEATGWAPHELAARVSVPVTCVETCLAHRASSQLLRAQLRAWIAAGRNLPNLPRSVYAAVTRDANMRESTAHSASVFDELDDVTREHFEYLQQSIGHNFVSILNDPSTNAPTDGTWASWLSTPFAAVASATGAVQTSDAARQATLKMVTSSVLADSQPAEFNDYLSEVSQPYRAHRELQRAAAQMRVLLPAAAAEQAAQAAPRDEGGAPALPEIVPIEFASEAFSVEKILRSNFEPDGTDEAVPPSSKAIGAVDALLSALDEQHEAVRVTLMTQVHARSRDFFEASKLFDNLVHESSAALHAVQATRNDVQDGGVTLVHNFLRIAQQSRRRRNCARLAACAAEIQRAQEALTRVDDCVADGRMTDACVALREAHAIVDATSQTRFYALDSARRRLSDRRRSLSLIMENSAASLLCFEGWNDTNWEALRDVVAAAVHLDCIDETMRTYHQQAGYSFADAALTAACHDAVEGVPRTMAELRKVSGESQMQTLTSSVRSLVAQQVHLIKPSAFHSLTLRLLEAIDEQAHHAFHHMEIVLELHPTMDTDTAGGDAARPASYAWTLRHVEAIAAAAQDALVWLFDGRTEDSVASFSPTALDRFVTRVTQGVAALEDYLASERLKRGVKPEHAHGRWSKVRGCLGKLVSTFFRRHKDRASQTMMQVLAADTWEVVENVDAAFQRHVTTLCTSDAATAARIATTAVDVLARHTPNAQAAASPDGGGPPFPQVGSDAEPVKRLAVPRCADTFAVSHSLLMLLQMLAEFDWFVCRYPFLAHDAITNIFSALKMYNGQCAALVLAAGAVDHGTVPTIGLKHHALGMQCVGLLAVMTPQLMARLAAITAHVKGGGDVAKTLEGVTRDLVDHRNEFASKILSAFRERTRSLEVDAAHWAVQGNAFVMASLKAAMKVHQQVKGILSEGSGAYRSVTVPMVNGIAGRVRDAAGRVAPDAVPALHHDIALLKANAEGLLGCSIVHCASLPTIAAAAAASESMKPETAEEVLECLGAPQQPGDAA